MNQSKVSNKAITGSNIDTIEHNISHNKTKTESNSWETGEVSRQRKYHIVMNTADQTAECGGNPLPLNRVFKLIYENKA